MEVVILAAGKGTRMYSSKPKVLHQIGGKPMLEHVIQAARELGSDKIHVVIGYGADQITGYFDAHANSGSINWVSQEEQLGTGHAAQQAMPAIDSGNENNPVLVLYGDVPLINPDQLTPLLEQAGQGTLALLSLVTDAPAGLGRIVRGDSGEVQAIVEERDASEEQKQINEVNSGIMAMPAAKLGRWLNELGNANDQGEYYLTDIVAMAAAENCPVAASQVSNWIEVQGVNDKSQLALLERHYQMNKTEELLNQGVTLRDPSRVEIRGELECGKDVEIDVNVIFEGKVSLGNNVTIGANTIIKDTVIADGANILPGTNTDNASIGANASVGPYARIRPGTVLGAETKIGNFVETKNVTIGKGSKASHLAYLGDAEMGEGVNIGAGTIICNYDGVNKHKTKIGNNVFVGSNSVLIAPVELADGAFVAAGSAINSDVPSDHLAVGRGKQRNIPGWKRPRKSEL